MIKRAEDDMYVCKKVEPDFPDEAAARAASYHVQQAVEKLLKAYILFYGEEPPYRHDISELCGICVNLGAELPNEINEIADTLTLWESKTRYDPYVSFSVEKYKKACAAYDILYKKIKEETQ
jgi:HEPN domain-containing protein